MSDRGERKIFVKAFFSEKSMTERNLNLELFQKSEIIPTCPSVFTKIQFPWCKAHELPLQRNVPLALVANPGTCFLQ